MGGHQLPIITHTAATPQDSPNTTLDVEYRDINCRAIYPTTLSIESIDRSSSQCSIYSGFLKPPDNNNKNSVNNFLTSQPCRRISLVTSAVNSNSSTKESAISRYFFQLNNIILTISNFIY